jgi:hypothetical protein
MSRDKSMVLELYCRRQGEGEKVERERLAMDTCGGGGGGGGRERGLEKRVRKVKA